MARGLPLRVVRISVPRAGLRLRALRTAETQTLFHAPGSATDVVDDVMLFFIGAIADVLVWLPVGWVMKRDSYTRDYVPVPVPAREPVAALAPPVPVIHVHLTMPQGMAQSWPVFNGYAAPGLPQR